jgi:hypothetical protein
VGAGRGASGSIAAAFAAAALALPALALVPEAVERQCPMDDTRFESWVMRSGSVFCVRLDLKRVGPIAEPPPLHECPEDGFVWYDDDFSPSELAFIRSWVASSDYENLVENESPHYRLARIYERLGRDSRMISREYRRAAWEVEKVEPAKYPRYLRRSLLRLLESGEGDPDASLTVLERERRGLLAGELERQLGEFESARVRFESMRAAQLVEALHEGIVDYELELIAARDSEPRFVPSEGVDEATCLHWDPRPTVSRDGSNPDLIEGVRQ